MMNEYRGEVVLDIDGEPVVLRFTWNALARLKSEFGTEYEKEIGRITNEMDVGGLARVLSIGAFEHRPDLTPERISAASPPVVLATQAIGQALTKAYWGGEDPERDEAPGKLMARVWTRLLRSCGLQAKPD